MKDEENYLVTNKSRDGTSRTMPDCEGSSGSTRLLRPARTPSSDLKTDRKAQDTDGMRLVDNGKMVESLNTAYRLHPQDSSQCDMPHTVIANEMKWGVCWGLTLRCINCEFRTSEFKLYRGSLAISQDLTQEHLILALVLACKTHPCETKLPVSSCQIWICHLQLEVVCRGHQ